MIRRFLRGIRADSEAENDRDGYLSTRAEWHSAAWGFSSLFLATFFRRWELAGLVVGTLLTGHRGRREVNLPYPRQILKEALYALAHGVVGVVLALLVRVQVGL